MDEVWLPVHEFEETHIVSNFGRVIYLKPMRKRRNSTTHKKGEPYIMTPFVNSSGYLCLGIGTSRNRIFRDVHRLVALAFIPNPENKLQVNHIDGDKLNNHIANLEWVTHKENVQHAYKTGLVINPRGEKSRRSKLTDAQITEILLDPRHYTDIAVDYGITKAYAWKIKTGKANRLSHP